VISCSSPDENTTTNVTTTTAETTDAETSETKINPGLPEDKYYDGYEFRVLTKGLTNVHWKSFDIAAPETNGDPLNDAVYARNLALNEKYGVTVLDIPGNYGDLPGDARKAILSGDDVYDMLAFHTAGLIADGYLIDLTTVPYMDLSQPYYDQNCVESLAIKDSLYLVSGDMLTMDNNATWCVQFNKQLVEDLSFAETYGMSMYEMTDTGKWTLDTFYDTAKTAARDVNGDGVMKELVDVWGFQTEDYNQYAMLVGSGETIAKVNKEGIPEITLSSDRVVQVLEKVVRIQADKEVGLNASVPKGYSDVWSECMDKNFEDSLVLYNMAGLNRVTLFRTMEVDFGILPIPKYDELQEGYHNPVSLGCANFISIPLTASDLERTGIIIEFLSCESKYTLLPAYYDLTLKTKASRDDESSAMLDLIFATTVFDIGSSFNWGDVSGKITGLKDAGQFVSSLAKSEKAIQTALDKTMAFVEENL
jgi:predicted heme/steroid binding protein